MIMEQTQRRWKSKEWEECCNQALLGAEWKWLDEFEEDQQQQQHVHEDQKSTSPSETIQLINLMEEEEEEEEKGESEYAEVDTWSQNAYRIRDSLLVMQKWISTKSFVNIDIPEEEASLFQSTVTSFLATTANEIETLRNMIDSRALDASHKTGVCASLLLQLQQDVAQPFSRLQKLRSRTAVSIWQDPIHCSLYQPTRSRETFEKEASTAGADSAMRRMLDEDDRVEREQRFIPQARNGPMAHDEIRSRFLTRNASQSDEDIKIPPRPDILQEPKLPASMNSRFLTSDEQQSSSFSIPQPRNLVAKKPEVDRLYQEELSTALQQESLLLQASMQNDLDSVQLMEQRMVDITTLISQFSNLVSEQQEEILQIHEAAENTKENVAKGQDSLVDAADRANRSRHYKATIIFGLSLALLFFHFLRA